MLAAFAPVTTASIQQAGTAPVTAWARALDAHFSSRFPATTPGCVVGVLQEGQLRYARGFGLASLEWGLPITRDTKFRIASVSKQFTGFVVARLVEQGAIDPSAPVRTYLPDLSQTYRDVTVADLAHHTSGTRDYGTSMFFSGAGFNDRSTETEVVQLIERQSALNFVAGTDFIYSNSGYVLLARIVDQVTGQSLQQTLSDWVFEPLGMRDTTVHDAFDLVIPRLAPAYRPDGEAGFVRNVPSSMIRGAAGVVTTLSDLALWEAAMQNPPPDWQPVVARMHESGQLRDGTAVPYGYGLFFRQLRGLDEVDHGGSYGGYRASITRLRDRPLSIILLCNRADVAPRREVTAALEAIVGDDMEPAPPAPAASSEEPASSDLTVPEPLARSLLGRFHSTDLDVDVEFRVGSAGDLVLVMPRNQQLAVTRSATDEKVLEAATGFMPLILRLDPHTGTIDGFAVDFFRETGIRFDRVPG